MALATYFAKLKSAQSPCKTSEHTEYSKSVSVTGIGLDESKYLKNKDFGLSFSETTSAIWKSISSSLNFFPILLRYRFTYFCFFSWVLRGMYSIFSSSAGRSAVGNINAVAAGSSVFGSWMLS